MKIGNVLIDNRVFLAPMAGITDVSYRSICKEFGAGLTYSEMVSAKGLYYHDEKTKMLTKRGNNEKPFAIQIFGSDGDIMAEVAEKLSDEADIIDINFGCPAPKVVKNEDGAKLMLYPEKIDEILDKVVKKAKVPITIKIRKGWDKEHVNAVEIAKIAEKNGVSAIGIHGRTREEFYSKKADWEIIKQVVDAVSIPVIGNGDVVDLASAKALFATTGCAAIMIGRGSLGNPWIFQEILEEKEIVKSKQDIYEMIIKHFQLLMADKGEYTAIREMRKFISWYVKGLDGSTQFRRRVNQIETKEELWKQLKDFLGA